MNTDIWLMRGLMFHLEEGLNVELLVVSGGVNMDGTFVPAREILDTAIIAHFHEPPEPMSIALLDLGGSGLLRRRCKPTSS